MLHSTSKLNYWLQCLLNSYSLLFFSLNNVLALCIVIVTFFTPVVGLCGLLAIVLINGTAYLLGFDVNEIKGGTFGFNAVFMGMALGHEYSINGTFALLFVSSILLLLLITVWLKGLFGARGLPFLSFPFLVSYWILSLAATNFSNIHFDENHIYLANDAVRNQASAWYNAAHSLDAVQLPSFVLTYFKTLASVFFQQSVLGGMLVSFGLLYASRIAFSLSIIGFAMAYFFYAMFGADVADLNYNLLGANFIFLAIAVGCFFLLPNARSYFTVLLLVPILMLVALSLSKILMVFQLKSYSLSFSMVTTAFLFSLNQRVFQYYLQLVTVQYYSAEKTIYKYLNSVQRFKNEHLYKLILPVSGEWQVSQGYDGKITHLGDWSKALDFVIVDSKNNTYREPTRAQKYFKLDNFYCYNKEVYAPFDGYVYDITNTVEDNDVGDVNTQQNWGNTIIINHLNGLYSQISHCKKDSFGVYIGQYVTKGMYLATCGNSGRSPEPHIHFQLQTIPTVGAKTLAYPIGYYIERIGEQKHLRVSQVPTEGAHISNVQVNQLLLAAFALYPGVKLKFKNNNTTTITHWEVLTDAYNKTYIYCAATNSYAYFVNDGVMFYFTDFEGDNTSLLFYFYLAAYRQLLGYYDNVTIQDNVPLVYFNNKAIQFFQDFVAPFYLFTKANFTSTFTYVDNMYAPQKLIIASQVTTMLLNQTFKKINFELELKDNSLHTFTVHNKHKTIIYTLVN
jgi:urea transporter/murein DD-endopeptidase MepM/ murein hydrolase activator NlpD